MLPEIEALLRQKIGLDAASIGSGAIARAVRYRMADCGVAELHAYVTKLQTSPQEWDALIENVIVPETWFFRDREPFNFLSRYAMTEWLPANPGAVLRVLSVPCSTGEEPYSIAIALIEAGFAAKNFRIDAVDISKKSLLKAKIAVYDKNSFRGETSAFTYSHGYSLREQYFVETERGYQLNESVIRTVNFIFGNILEPYYWWNQNCYDAIFCRNLLIYLDGAARERSLQILERLLTPKGLLFVGHSETGQLLASRFVSVRQPRTFAYGKVARGEVQFKIKSLPAIKTKNLSVELTTKLPSASKSAIQSGATGAKIAVNSPLLETGKTTLETARILADRGQLDEAATLCETYLSQNPVSAEAYVLLGEVRQAAGKEEMAIACFERAIYLAPDRYEALMHLALLKEHRGDLAGAAILKQRIQRIQKFEVK